MTSSESREGVISEIATLSGSPLPEGGAADIRQATEGRYLDSLVDATPAQPVTID